MFSSILSWCISPCPQLTSALIKCIHWHIVFNLWQATAPLNHAFIKYTACNKSWVVDLFSTGPPLTCEYLSAISFQRGLWEHLVSVPEPKGRFPEATVFWCYIFWRAVSTDETSYEAGIKVQIHSQDEPPFIDQLGFGVAPGFQTFVSCQQQLVSNVQPPPLQPRLFYCSASFCVCPQILASQRPLPLCLRTWSKIRLLIYLRGEMCSYSKVLYV